MNLSGSLQRFHVFHSLSGKFLSITVKAFNRIVYSITVKAFNRRVYSITVKAFSRRVYSITVEAFSVQSYEEESHQTKALLNSLLPLICFQSTCCQPTCWLNQPAANPPVSGPAVSQKTLADYKLCSRIFNVNTIKYS